MALGLRTKREAERSRTDLLSKLDRGEYVEPSRQTVGAFLLAWLAAIEPTVRPSTFDSYSRNVHNHVIAYIGEVRSPGASAFGASGMQSESTQRV